MKIEDLDDAECDVNESVYRRQIVRVDAKRALVGAGARILFYPTLLYNVFRNKIQAEFRWWDEVDQFLLLGAVPFPKDVPRLKQLGVGGVITLNEPYETLVPTSLYHAHEIDHLVIPTRDYLFAPSFVDISRAVDFIHKNASCGRTTYVHCKAGRGRSTTVVLCYLEAVENMVAIASQLTDESTEAPKIDVAQIYLQAVGVEPKKRRVYGLGTHASTFYPDSVSSSSSASSHYNTLFDERLREELQEIQENLHRKNEEMQQKNEEMQKQIEEMKKKEEERLKREDEMQQKILHMEQIMCKLAQTSSIYQPPVEDPSRSPEVTTHTDSE